MREVRLNPFDADGPGTAGSGPDAGGPFGPGFDDGLGGPGAGLELPPWERRERFGFLNAFYLTVKDVLLAPGRFFQRMPSAVGVSQPLFFAIVIGAIATFVSWMWALTGSSLQALLGENLEEIVQGPLYSFILFLFSPVVTAVLLFIQAGLAHLILLLVGGGKLGFEATFRVCAYSEAASLLVLVPVCGQGIAIVWNLVIMIIGLYHIHETEPWKAVVAVLAPTLVCLGVLGGGLMLALMALN